MKWQRLVAFIVGIVALFIAYHMYFAGRFVGFRDAPLSSGEIMQRKAYYLASGINVLQGFGSFYLGLLIKKNWAKQALIVNVLGLIGIIIILEIYTSAMVEPYLP